MPIKDYNEFINEAVAVQNDRAFVKIVTMGTWTNINYGVIKQGSPVYYSHSFTTSKWYKNRIHIFEKLKMIAEIMAIALDFENPKWKYEYDKHSIKWFCDPRHISQEKRDSLGKGDWYQAKLGQIGQLIVDAYNKSSKQKFHKSQGMKFKFDGDIADIDKQVNEFYELLSAQFGGKISGKKYGV